MCPSSAASLGLSLRRKRISAEAPGVFTQSSSKNSVSVGGGGFVGDACDVGDVEEESTVVVPAVVTVDRI